MKKFVPRFVPQAAGFAVTVMAIAMAAFLLVGCEEGASPNNDGLVDGFLVRVNEKPGAGTGSGTPKYKVTVLSNGTGTYGGGDYEKGATVVIDAGIRPNPYRFEKWTTESSGVTFADDTRANTAFNMPTHAVTVKAVFWDWGTLTDGRDQKKYKTAKIGTQTWMAENLNITTDSGSWCYGNINSNCDTYGRLYDWNTARTVCPAGWHLPSIHEWETLVDYVGGSSTAGKKLKSASGWGDCGSGTTVNGTDDYGFSALPGGWRSSGGTFDDADLVGYWWTTVVSVNSEYIRLMDCNSQNVFLNSYNYRGGYSVRCVRD